jgi:hypothetical protein
MKRIFLIAGLLALAAAVFFAVALLSAPKEGTMETFSELHDAKLGNAYIRGRYGGFPTGWDICFFHLDSDGRLVAYYLAHESSRWDRAKLVAQENLVTVKNGDRTVAEFDTIAATFTHKLQGVTYTTKDGLEGAYESTRRIRTVKLP